MKITIMSLILYVVEFLKIRPNLDIFYIQSIPLVCSNDESERRLTCDTQTLSFFSVINISTTLLSAVDPDRTGLKKDTKRDLFRGPSIISVVHF